MAQKESIQSTYIKSKNILKTQIKQASQLAKKYNYNYNYKHGRINKKNDHAVIFELENKEEYYTSLLVSTSVYEKENHLNIQIRFHDNVHYSGGEKLPINIKLNKKVSVLDANKLIKEIEKSLQKFEKNSQT